MRKTIVIGMDSYFKEPGERPCAVAPVTGKAYRDDNHPLTCNLPDLERDLAEAAESGKYQVIIVEGLLTLWDQKIYDRLDLRLFPQSAGHGGFIYPFHGIGKEYHRESCFLWDKPDIMANDSIVVYTNDSGKSTVQLGYI